jgi:hypothetical protein
MNRRKALLGIAAGSAAATGSVALAQNPQAGGPPGSMIVPLSSAAGAVIGTLSIRRFVAVNDQLHAIAVVTATDTLRAANNAVRSVVGTLLIPVTPRTGAQQQGSCPILHLEIGPINLNLLGLEITTEPIVIDIVAVPGPGNLLGNLLCAIAGLLDPGNLPIRRILNQLVGLLNQLVNALG